MFTVEIKRRALRKLGSLDEKRKARLRKVVPALKEDPVPFRKMDICRLRDYENAYRARVGSLEWSTGSRGARGRSLSITSGQGRRPISEGRTVRGNHTSADSTRALALNLTSKEEGCAYGPACRMPPLPIMS
jgi:hypothetical protein